MKIALVLAPVWDASWPVASLAILSAELRRRGHEVRVFDLNKEISSLRDGPASRHYSNLDSIWYDAMLMETKWIPAYEGVLNDFLERLLSGEPALVGFSLQFSNRIMSGWLAREIKKRAPRTVVVFGGPLLTKASHWWPFASPPEIDAKVFGEADISFPALVEHLEAHGSVSAAPGVLLGSDPTPWDGNQVVCEDLDGLAYADYSDFALEHYSGKILQTSRGCPRRCVFCSGWRQGVRFRQMTGDRIFAEVQYQLKQDPEITNFYFADSTLNGDMESLSRFCDLVIANNVRIRWRAFAIVRPEMTPAFLEKMRRAGCEHLIYGVETGSARLLKDMGKPVTPELNGRVLRDSKRAGIYTAATMMVGFPTEREAHFLETLDFVRAYADGIGDISVSLFSVEEMQGDWQRFGFIPTSHSSYWSTPDGQNTYPIRLARLRALVEACEASSVCIYFEGLARSSEMPRTLGDLMSHYRRWAAEHPSEVAP